VESVRQRALSIFEEKVVEQQDCILVSHGDPLTLLYYHLLDKKLPKEMWKPENEELIIAGGEIVQVDINQKKSIALKRYKV